jgi:hypothetical protein
MTDDLYALADRMNTMVKAPGFIGARVEDEDRRILALDFTSAEAAEEYKFTLEIQGVTFRMEIPADSPHTLVQFR